MITVIIPVFNAQHSIEKCLNSVINQKTDYKFEIIIINDGSTDKCQEIIEAYIAKNKNFDIQLINQKNKGVSEARNQGLKKGKGKWFALLDADDVWLPYKTQQQMQVFNKNENIDLLGTGRNNNKIKWPYISGKEKLTKVTLNKLLIRNELLPSTVIFKRKVFENTGFFEPERRYAEDVDYWMRATLHNHLYILDKNGVTAGDGKRSFGISGLSANLKEMQKGFLKNIKKLYLDQRINKPKYYFFIFFQNCKYLLLQIRSLF